MSHLANALFVSLIICAYLTTAVNTNEVDYNPFSVEKDETFYLQLPGRKINEGKVYSGMLRGLGSGQGEITTVTHTVSMFKKKPEYIKDSDEGKYVPRENVKKYEKGKNQSNKRQKRKQGKIDERKAKAEFNKIVNTARYSQASTASFGNTD